MDWMEIGYLLFYSNYLLIQNGIVFKIMPTYFIAVLPIFLVELAIIC